MKSAASAPESFPVIVETISYVNDMVGLASGTGQKDFEEPAFPGDTVRSVLKRFASRFPKLKEALWDPDTGDMGGHIEIIINDALMGVKDDLDSPVKARDRITLTGQYIGG